VDWAFSISSVGWIKRILVTIMAVSQIFTIFIADKRKLIEFVAIL